MDRDIPRVGGFLELLQWAINIVGFPDFSACPARLVQVSGDKVKYMLRSLLIALTVVLAVTGCGNKSPDAKKVATQVAARVNKEEISVHQINDVLARAGNVKPEQAKQATQQVLDKLIDQELLVQQAVENKLDRDPRVLQAIEASKREILARSYLEQLVASVAKPDDAAIKSFYNKNPALFSERRLFNLQELVVNATPEQTAAIQQLISQGKALNDLLNYLKEQNIQYKANAGVKAAEQLPLELLPKIHSFKDGQIALIPYPSGLTLVHLAGSQSRPLDEAAARPFIEQYLANQKRAEIAANEIKQLKVKAKIEFLGDFGPASLATAANPPSGAAQTAVSQSPAPAATQSKPADQALEKGIQGLK